MKATPVILSDALLKDEAEKLGLIGIFGKMFYWDLPFSRSWIATVMLRDVPITKKDKIGKVYVRQGTKEIFSKKFTVSGGETEITAAQQVIARFTSDKKHYCGFEIAKKRFEIPLILEKKTLPKFTNLEIKKVRNSSKIQKEIKINVSCLKCSTPYTFLYVPFDNTKKPAVPGIKSMPQQGKFQCEKCTHQLDLNDIKAQVLASIKLAVERGQV